MDKIKQKTAGILLTGCLLSLGLPQSSLLAEVKTAEQKMDRMVQEAKITKEQALDIAQSFVSVPMGYQLTNQQFFGSWYERAVPVWVFNWNLKDESKPAGYEVVVHALNGEVLSFNWWKKEEKPVTFPPKVKWAEAKQIAYDYIKKQFPAQANEVKLEREEEPAGNPPLSGHIDYNFTFLRDVGGIPFVNNRITVRINGGGEIVNVHYRWDEGLKFPDGETVIGKEEAEQKLFSNIDFRLTYLRTWEEVKYRDGKPEEPKIYLGYRMPYGSTIAVDAKTGDLLDPFGRKMAEKETTGHSRVVSEPITKVPSPSAAELTQEQALGIVKKYFQIHPDLEMRDVRYMDNWNGFGKAVWEFNWSLPENANRRYYQYTRAAVDAKTGEIVSFYREQPVNESEKQEQKIKISEAEAKNKAVELVKKLSPSLAHQVYVESRQEIYEEKMPQFYHFFFGRLKNNIPVLDQGITVRINGETGELSEYNVNWDSFTYPEPGPELLDEKLAREMLMEEMKIDLQYFLPERLYGKEREQQDKVFLVYRLLNKETGEPAKFLDARAKKWRSLENGEFIRGSELPEDIKGHPAEKELSLMYRYNAFEVDENNKVHPNENIKRGELIKMLMLAINQGRFHYFGGGEAAFSDVKRDSAYFNYVQAAAEQNLLDKSKKELKPEGTVDREELAVLITRALGFSGLAKYESLFQVPFQDLDRIKAKGDVAIVTGLGIMDARNNAFMPDEKVTRAEAAVAFYRFLEKRAEFSPDRYPRF